MCSEIYELEYSRFLTPLGLAWQAPLTKNKSKIRNIN